MKQVSRRFRARLSTVTLAVLVLVMVAGSLLVPSFNRQALAESYQDQIDDLNAQNAQAQQGLSAISGVISSYQDEVNQLQSRIDQIQSQININESKRAVLQKQINDAQLQLDQQKQYLSDSIKTMYVDGTPSTLEVLATSKDLSDFVDKQEYRTAVQHNIQDTLKKISDLQAQLKTDQAAVAKVLADEQDQRASLDDSMATQAHLLNMSLAKQQSYNDTIAANNARLTQLVSLMTALNTPGSTSGNGTSFVAQSAWGFTSCGGGYSYCGYGLDEYTGDPWGLELARECVHYVADYLWRHGKDVGNMGGTGSAYQWPEYAGRPGRGYLVSSPQPGDAIYMPVPGFGHIGIVESVNGDGTVTISQYNWAPRGIPGGWFSYMRVYTHASGVRYIRFNNR